MREMFPGACRSGALKAAIAAFMAAELCLFAPCFGRLLSENIQLVRKGVMVDPSFCECPGIGAGWEDFNTSYFKVSVDGGVDLRRVERQLRRRLFLPDRGGPQDAGAHAAVAFRLDAICEKAMDVLDMHPKMKRLEIRIFKSRGDLNTAYRMLTGNPGDIKAFHVNDCATIFTSEEDIGDSVMAHEIAHAIVDSQYNGIPPPKVGEMLASYVDMHISD
jgi:hypothetical protein